MNERRTSYDSGNDFVLESEDIRATFEAHDFRQRVEMAARQLGLIYPDHVFSDAELEDLENLVVNGEISEDVLSELGEHIDVILFEEYRNGVSQEQSLTHWLRRIIFREAWMDQRIVEGRVELVLDQDAEEFIRVDADSKKPFILETPSWSHRVYEPK